MKKNIISSTNALMRQLVGLTGHAESFAPKKSIKVKPFNSERYMNAFTALQTDAAVAKAEMFEIKVFILERKAMGEADATILGKVKNGATDLWRKVKELIGKLIILAEEFFRGLFDKTKKAEKVAKAAENVASGLKKTLGNLKANTSLSLDEKLEVRVNKKFVAAISDDKNSIGTHKIGDKPSVTDVVSALEQAASDKADGLATTKAADFWLKFQAKKAKDTVYKEVFKALKGAAVEVKKTGTYKKADSLVFGKDTNNKLDTSSGLLQYVESIEKGNLELKRLKEKVAKESKKSEAEVVPVEKQEDVEILAKYCAFAANLLRAQVETQKEQAKSIKEIKLVLNKVKNAPTKVTGNTDPKVLQIIRTYCTRMSTSLNLVRSISNVELNKTIVSATELVSAAKQVISQAEGEYADNVDEDYIGSKRYSANAKN